tara:strand:+ start:83593 stop:84051 length:459 start_codon:yes stop_codon:yes gene_type:complete
MLKRILLLNFLLIAGCTNLTTSDPLFLDNTNSSKLSWSASGRVTACEATTVEDISFELDNSGNWKTFIKVKNTDRSYRPYWKNSIDLVLSNSDTNAEIGRLEILNEAMKGGRYKKYEMTGIWDTGQKDFRELKQAAVSAVHECSGLHTLEKT